MYEFTNISGKEFRGILKIIGLKQADFARFLRRSRSWVNSRLAWEKNLPEYYTKLFIDFIGEELFYRNIGVLRKNEIIRQEYNHEVSKQNELKMVSQSIHEKIRYQTSQYYKLLEQKKRLEDEISALDDKKHGIWLEIAESGHNSYTEK